jgi:hypothetical protein
MNKLNKIGLSALAGTLVSFSAAQAGGVSVNGTAEMSYKNLPNYEVTGSKYGTKKNITFTGSGEFANGWTFGILHTLNDTMSGQSSSSMNINMGWLTVGYDSGTGGYGANAVDNVVPTAWEEVDYGFATGLTDVGAVSKQHGVINLTAKAPGSGTALSLSYVSRMNHAAVADGGVSGAGGAGQYGVDVVLDFWNINTKYFGLRTGAAAEKVSHLTCRDINPSGSNANQHCGSQKGDAYAGTIYQTLKVGPLSAGFQATYKDPGTAGGIENNQAWVAGAALTIGDYLSVSYGKGWDEYYHSTINNAGNLGMGTYTSGTSGDNLERVHASYHGWSAAMNFGPIALKAVTNRVQNEGGTHSSVQNNANGSQRSEINLSMAF